MATQKRSTRSTSKKSPKAKTVSQARKRSGLKAKSPSSSTRRKRSTAAESRAKARTKGTGVIKRAIKKGISELAKVGT